MDPWESEGCGGYGAGLEVPIWGYRGGTTEEKGIEWGTLKRRIVVGGGIGYEADGMISIGTPKIAIFLLLLLLLLHLILLLLSRKNPQIHNRLST